MSKDKLNDENYGTRDKRGHWKNLKGRAVSDE